MVQRQIQHDLLHSEGWLKFSTQLPTKNLRGGLISDGIFDMVPFSISFGEITANLANQKTKPRFLSSLLKKKLQVENSIKIKTLKNMPFKLHFILAQKRHFAAL